MLLLTIDFGGLFFAPQEKWSQLKTSGNRSVNLTAVGLLIHTNVALWSCLRHAGCAKPGNASTFPFHDSIANHSPCYSGGSPKLFQWQFGGAWGLPWEAETSERGTFANMCVNELRDLLVLPGGSFPHWYLTGHALISCVAHMNGVYIIYWKCCQNDDITDCLTCIDSIIIAFLIFKITTRNVLKTHGFYAALEYIH